MGIRPGHRSSCAYAVLLAGLTAGFVVILAAAVTSGPYWFVVSTSERTRIWFAQWNAQIIIADHVSAMPMLGNPPRFGFIHFRPMLRAPAWCFDYDRSTSPVSNITQLVIPLWAPLLATGVPAAWMWRKRLVHCGRVRRGECLGCGYDLRATPRGTPCPECGAITAAAAPLPTPQAPSEPPRPAREPRA